VPALVRTNTQFLCSSSTVLAGCRPRRKEVAGHVTTDWIIRTSSLQYENRRVRTGTIKGPHIGRLSKRRPHKRRWLSPRHRVVQHSNQPATP